MSENAHVDPMCLTCLFLIGWEWPTCTAFPDGIPEDIQLGKFDHTKPHEGDNGIQYKAVTG